MRLRTNWITGALVAFVVAAAGVGLAQSLVRIEGGSNVALGDNLASVPTVSVGAFLMCYDGATWDRCLAASDATHDSTKSATGPQEMLAAVAHGADPTAVTAGDAVNGIANRDGVAFTIGGHPNVITETVTVTDADGAQTGVAIASVSTGNKIVVTRVAAKCSGSNTAKPDVRVALDTDGTFTANATTGVVGHVDGMDDIPAGGGFSSGNGGGILAVGADDEDLRYSLGDPEGGSCTLTVSYYLVES